MSLTLNRAVTLLKQHDLLREIVTPDRWTLDAASCADVAFAAITYDTRRIEPGTLLICKGRFSPKFLDGCDERGLAAYVSETEFSEHTHMPGLIVNDARKALSLLAAEFYEHPEHQLTLIGITGTKGKTTTAYFTQAVLNAHSDGRCALFSSVDNCLDGHTYVESDLTTPESLDALRMMRQAVDNGMKYLVMEVSSQAYKVQRLYGITFDVGAFLNISPDHISPIEHPTFEDYLYCKRQLITHARTLVLNTHAAHVDLLREDAADADVPVHEFALLGEQPNSHSPVTCGWPCGDKGSMTYHFRLDGEDLSEYALDLAGDFNVENALAAVTIAHAAGVPANATDDLHAMQHTHVPGRMEQFDDKESDTHVIVDYAHNFASVERLIDYVDARYGECEPAITLVTGSAGNKALDRRREIVEAAQMRIARFIFTAEDTDTEPHEDICNSMMANVTNPQVEASIILNRADAIAEAISDAKAHAERTDVILVIGKGNERWIKDFNKHTPYEGDDHVVKRLLNTT